METIFLLATIFTTSFVVALSGAMMPGPMFTYTISEASKRGMWSGPLLIIGHAILEFTLLILLVMGFGAVLKKEITFAVIGILGAVIMLYMAFGMIRTLPVLTLAVQTEKSEKVYKNPIFAGIVISVLNPYWAIWWATIGFTYVTLSFKNGLMGIAAFFFGHILADFIWYFFVSFSIAKSRAYINDRVYKMVIALCACALIYFAFSFGFAGVEKLMSLYRA